MSVITLLCLSGIVATTIAHSDHSQQPIAGPHQSLWYNRLPGDGERQVLTSNQLSQVRYSASYLILLLFRPIRSFPEYQPSAGCPITHAWRVMRKNTTLPSLVFAPID